MEKWFIWRFLAWALDLEGGPVWVSDPYDSTIIIDPEHHQYQRQPHICAMAHFSKFLAPGSVRVDSAIVTQKNNKAIVGAFRKPHNSTVVVVVNNHDDNVQLIIDDSKAGKLTAIVEPRSIQTYVYYD